MNILQSINQTQSISMAIMAALWLMVAVWAPERAFKLGLQQEDPPIFFRLRPFRFLQVLALALMAGAAFLWPMEWLTQVTLNEVADGLLNTYLGSLLAVLLTVLLLFVLPEMTARQRIRAERDPGEFRTPMLVLFRWTWLGVALLAVLRFWQHLPYLQDYAQDQPLTVPGGCAVAVGGTAIYLAWWWLPSLHVARMAAGEDPHAIATLPVVRWFGVPAWLRFGIQRGFRHKPKYDQGTHKLCPSCMRPIDQIELYDSLKFDTCPHCGELVPPVYEIEDYIRHFSGLARELSEAKASGKKSRRGGGQDSEITQRVLRAIFCLALRERATDLHFVCEGENYIVRARTDGMLFTMLELHEPLMKMMISALKVQARLDITERRKPQDGSFNVVAGERNVDIRLNTSPSHGGETASLRLLYRHEVLGSLGKIGLSHRNHRQFLGYLQRPHGLILVTGPTGSGKSTTLYNALATIADGKRNIITLEDPIEYKIDGLTQMNVEPSRNFTFVSGLRSILRQDPDVIMVGEIRDGETAKMTIDAAMTGHLVFSTLHTIDTSTCVGRLLDLGVDPHRHAEALLLIIAQRLVRLNCELCVEDYEMTPEDLAALNLPGLPHNLVLKRGRGCPRCHESRFFEREGIYEILSPDDKLREMISAKAQAAEIKRHSRRAGMRTLLEDGLAKAVLGRTTIEEVLRVTA